jgi:hypothetical protein
MRFQAIPDKTAVKNRWSPLNPPGSVPGLSKDIHKCTQLLIMHHLIYFIQHIVHDDGCMYK